MRNTPAAIARGITVAVPNVKVTRDQRALADQLLGAVGAVEWVEDELLLDAVTAVSGSGPAYVFLLAEDRKSTRLNSSHLVISYAVFCLKKKKKSRNFLYFCRILS